MPHSADETRPRAHQRDCRVPIPRCAALRSKADKNCVQNNRSASCYFCRPWAVEASERASEGTTRPHPNRCPAHSPPHDDAAPPPFDRSRGPMDEQASARPWRSRSAPRSRQGQTRSASRHIVRTGYFCRTSAVEWRRAKARRALAPIAVLLTARRPHDDDALPPFALLGAPPNVSHRLDQDRSRCPADEKARARPLRSRVAPRSRRGQTRTASRCI